MFHLMLACLKSQGVLKTNNLGWRCCWQKKKSWEPLLYSIKPNDRLASVSGCHSQTIFSVNSENRNCILLTLTTQIFALTLNWPHGLCPADKIGKRATLGKRSVTLFPAPASSTSQWRWPVKSGSVRSDRISGFYGLSKCKIRMRSYSAKVSSAKFALYVNQILDYITG